MEGPVISAQRLTKVYGRHPAVLDLSFEVRPGLVTGFLGPNGAGTTTTVRRLLGLARPTSGAVTVLGRPYREFDRPSQALFVAASGRLDGHRLEPMAGAGRRTSQHGLRSSTRSRR